MILFNNGTRGRLGATSRMMSIGVLAILGLALISGCGQRYIQIDLSRPDKFSQPVRVGVYLLSQETALDALDNNILADPNGVETGGGVLWKDVFPIIPGETRAPIRREDYDPEIRWVVVAAGFPQAGRCARYQAPVKEDAELTLQVTVNDGCIDIKMN